MELGQTERLPGSLPSGDCPRQNQRAEDQDDSQHDEHFCERKAAAKTPIKPRRAIQSVSFPPPHRHTKILPQARTKKINIRRAWGSADTGSRPARSAFPSRT